jgi:hypothetical protein
MVVFQVGPRMAHLSTGGLPLDWVLFVGTKLYGVLMASHYLDPLEVPKPGRKGVG